MNVLHDEGLSPADQKVLDTLGPTVEQLTPAGQRKLLAMLARRCLPAAGGDVPLANDDGDVFAYVYSKQRPVYDLSGELTDEERAAFKRNVLDPRQHMTVEELLARLDAEDDRKDPTR
jgi:hypothetical protein